VIVIKRILSIVLACVLWLGLFAAVSAEGETAEQAHYRELMLNEIAYVKSLAFENGAIAMGPPAVTPYSGFELPPSGGFDAAEYSKWKSGRVIPYFSSFAALGVLDACAALGIDDGQELVLHYINWYIGHMNTKKSDKNGVAGTVYDYYIFQSTGGDIVEVTMLDAHASQYGLFASNPYGYDSTDSYAALFLQLLLRYIEVFDSSFLADKKALVDTLAGVMKATYVKALDLTGAKPEHMVCYLMDNCEVYGGFAAAAGIYELLGEAEAAKGALVSAEKVKQAVHNRFWSAGNKAYTAAVYRIGFPMYDTSQKRLLSFYPEAAAQLFPIIFGLLDPQSDRAGLVYYRFHRDFGQQGVPGRDWAALDKGDSFVWAILAKACVTMGDYGRAAAFVAAVEEKVFAKGRPGSQYYCAEAGHLLSVLATLYENGGAASGWAEDSETYERMLAEKVSLSFWDCLIAFVWQVIDFFQGIF